MKKTRIEKNYKETRFGFPIIIHNVQMIEVRGEWIPKINYVQLTNAVLKLLVTKNSFLSGNEIRFIRNHFEMTLGKFGERFDVSHQAVMKWEDQKDNPTKMNWSTEKDIRLFIYKSLFEKGFSEIYNKLEQKPLLNEKKDTELDIKSLEAVLI